MEPDALIDAGRYLAFVEAQTPRLAKARLFPRGWPLPMRRVAVLDTALKRFRRGAGIGLEFGVFKGASLRRAARRLPDRQFHGFDSFEGFPADGRPDWRLDFSTTARPALPSNCRLWEGWFSDTIPRFLAEVPDPIGFVHVDCDIYSSAREVLFGLRGRLAPGAVIVFDELLNYDSFLWNEMLALFEFLSLTGLGVDWIAIHQKVQGAGEAMAMLQSGQYPRWEDDVAAGYFRQAALVLTPGPGAAPELDPESRLKFTAPARAFEGISQRFGALAGRLAPADPAELAARRL